MGVDLEALALTVAQTLAQLQRATNAIAASHHSAFAKSPVRLRMVSALADGADTLVAQAALDAG